MRTTAALLTQVGQPLQVSEVELEPPRRDEVLVRLRASGICRSDLSLIKGVWPAPLPMVLGHEGAGVIEAVGPGVDPARVGEHVSPCKGGARKRGVVMERGGEARGRQAV